MSERILRETFYETTDRSARTRTDIPPLRGICLLNRENDNDEEDGKTAEDYTVLALAPREEICSACYWEHTPPQFPTRWTTYDQYVFPFT
jgi:hypothetical protein